MDLETLIRQVRRNVKLMIALPIVCVLLATPSFLLNEDIEYSATTSVIVIDGESGEYALGNNLQTTVNDIVFLATSDDVLAQAASSSNLDSLSGYSVSAKTAGNLTRVINITVTGPSQEKVREIAEGLLVSLDSASRQVANVSGVDVMKKVAVSEIAGSANSIRLVLAAIVGGLLLAVAIVSLRYMLDPRIRGLEDAANLLGVPPSELISFPGSRTLAHYKHDLGSDKKNLSNILAFLYADLPLGDSSSILVVGHSSTEAQSALSYGIAHAAADSGKKVLLVDWGSPDFEITTFFVENSLIAADDGRRAASSVVPSSISNLSFASGAWRDGGFCLDGSAERFLLSCKAEFDFIVAAGCSLSDDYRSVIASRLVSKTVLASVIGETNRMDYERSKAMLEKAGSCICDVFLVR